MTEDLDRAQKLPDATQLALDRTWLAHDRTLMAWVRTATSMISFGFTIYKFFAFENQHGASRGKLTPRDFALVMISIGVIALVFATATYRKEIRRLAPHSKYRHRSPTQFVAWIIILFGLFVLIAAIFRS